MMLTRCVFINSGQLKINSRIQFTERIVYFFNTLFVLCAVIISSMRIGASGEKEFFIYLGLVLILIYFSTLSITFYQANFKKVKGLSRMFKVISAIPMILVIPAAFLHTIVVFLTFDYFSLTISTLGVTWLVVTIWNIATKIKHS